MIDSHVAGRPSRSDVLRVVLIIPAALAAMLAAQYVVSRALADLLYLSGARREWVGWAWTTTNAWPASAWSVAITSGAIVAAVLAVAPKLASRATAVGLYALGILVSLVMIVVSVAGWPNVDGRQLVKVSAGWLGGGLAFWLGRRARAVPEPPPAVSQPRQS